MSLHYSVLLQESLDLLAIKPDGVYVDGTLGRAGHTKELLARLGANGRLISFDKDPDAITYAKETIVDSRLSVVHASFATLSTTLTSMGIQQVDGVLLDLGVSSPQIDTPERGFSFRFDAPLDMRMDNSKGISAAEWLNTVDEVELANVFWRYGEEKFSRRIARAIVATRTENPLTTTTQLANLISGLIPYKEKGQHPATRVFQAIRIQVNNELGDLEQVLATAPELLNLGGRLVVISFHSLEDRIVKTKFVELASSDKLPKWVMVQDEPSSEYKIIAKKIKASSDEISENGRSRSAIMRCLERVSVKSR